PLKATVLENGLFYMTDICSVINLSGKALRPRF
ncbi:MAG: hypothetical protein ACI85N_002079, partial [Gammaproteobacteria bacterium]